MRFCSFSCQRKSWKEHKRQCQGQSISNVTWQKNDKGRCAEGIYLWTLRGSNYYRFEQFGTCFFASFWGASHAYILFFSQSTCMLVPKNGGSAEFPRHLIFYWRYDLTLKNSMFFIVMMWETPFFPETSALFPEMFTREGSMMFPRYHHWGEDVHPYFHLRMLIPCSGRFLV